MNTTTNIPNPPPKFICSDDWLHVEAWMRTRPVNIDDNCVNRSARWTYKITDCGMFREIVAVDNSDGSEFLVPPPDPSTW